MRTSVWIFCLVVLLACAVVFVWSDAAASSDARRITPGELAEPPQGVAEVVTPVTMELPATMPSAQPGWELRFGELASQPVWLQSQEELEELADGLSADQWPRALSELASDGSSASIIMARRLVTRWGRLNPEAAAAWVSTLPDAEFAREMGRELATVWGEMNLPAATAWAQQLPAGGCATAATVSLGYVAAQQQQPTTALTLAATLPAGSEQNHLLDYAVRHWAVMDRAEAVAWTVQIGDETLRNELLKNMVTDWAATTPEKAAGWFANASSAGVGDMETLATIIRCWTAAAPEQSAAWVAQFPAGPLRTAALTMLMEVWAKLDSAQADAWIGWQLRE